MTSSPLAKSIFRFLRYFVVSALTVIVITYFSIRFWLAFRFQNVVEGKNYASFVTQIRSSDELPDALYVAYYKVHNTHNFTSTNSLILRTSLQLLGATNKREECSCFEVNYGFVDNFWDRLTVGLQLDHDVGGKKCLDYYMNNADFLFNTKGIKHASEHYFNKNISALNEKELLSLCVMLKNPSLYNPITNPDRLAKKLKEYE